MNPDNSLIWQLIIVFVPLMITIVIFISNYIIEKKKFKYSKKIWKEKMLIQLSNKIIQIRLKEYKNIWKVIEKIGEKYYESFDTTTLKRIASQIRDWRYSSAGLLASEESRLIAYDLQMKLWHSDPVSINPIAIQQLRNNFKDCLRADVGLCRYADGNSIYDKFAIILKSDKSKQNNK